MNYQTFKILSFIYLFMYLGSFINDNFEEISR